MIRAENIYFSYTGGQPYVFEGLEFCAEAGHYVSILGENGSGKSTFAKLLLGLLSPSRGTIEIDTDRRAYVPQMNEFADSRFPITVREMMDSYRRLIKVKDRSRTEAALEAVGMLSSEDKLVGSLSGGQRQKVFIARAIMGDPGLLVLDEPSAGVDAGSRREIYAYLRRLNTEKGMTILSVEHNLEAALRNSTAIYHIENGRGHVCTPEAYEREFLKLDKGDRP
jgi:zinc transport system ATP-binding protein